MTISIQPSGMFGGFGNPWSRENPDGSVEMRPLAEVPLMVFIENPALFTLGGLLGAAAGVYLYRNGKKAGGSILTVLGVASAIGAQATKANLEAQRARNASLPLTARNI